MEISGFRKIDLEKSGDKIDDKRIDPIIYRIAYISISAVYLFSVLC
jgi:hypothetical protein